MTINKKVDMISHKVDQLVVSEKGKGSITSPAKSFSEAIVKKLTTLPDLLAMLIKQCSEARINHTHNRKYSEKWYPDLSPGIITI